MSQLTTLPTFKATLSEAWELFQKKLGKLILISVGTFVIQFLVTLCFALLIGLGFLLGIVNLSNLHPSLGMPQALPIGLIMGVIIVAIFYFLAQALVIGLSYVYRFLYIDSKTEKFEFKIKPSLSYILPLFFTNILTSLLIMGGMFVFILPALVFSFFFMFVSQVVIYEKKSLVKAVGKSAELVSQNFGSLLVRVLVPFIAFAFIQAIVMSLIKQNPSVMFTLQLPMLILGMLEGYFMSIYSYVLYKQTARVYKKSSGSVLKWIVVVALIGYVILLSCIMGMVKVIKSPAGQKFVNTMRTNSVSSLNQAQGQNQNMISQGSASDFTLLLSQAQKLGSDAFSLINNKRIALGVAPLLRTDKLCAYAQHRLDVNLKRGSYDQGQGFYADLKDPKIGSLYFAKSTDLSELAYGPLDKTTTSAQIVDYWVNYAAGNGAQSGVLDKQFNSGCVVSGTQLMFLIISKPSN